MKTPLLALVCAFAFVVLGQMDMTDPELVSFELHESVFHYTDTPFVVPFTIKVRDNFSGVDYVSIYGMGQSREQGLFAFQGEQTITDTLRIPWWHEAIGNYYFNVYLVDNAGNGLNTCADTSCPFITVVDTSLNNLPPLELQSVSFPRDIYQRGVAIRPIVQTACRSGELRRVVLKLKHAELPEVFLKLAGTPDPDSEIIVWRSHRYGPGDPLLMRKGTYVLYSAELISSRTKITYDSTMLNSLGLRKSIAIETESYITEIRHSVTSSRTSPSAVWCPNRKALLLRGVGSSREPIRVSVADLRGRKLYSRSVRINSSQSAAPTAIPVTGVADIPLVVTITAGPKTWNVKAISLPR